MAENKSVKEVSKPQKIKSAEGKKGGLSGKGLFKIIVLILLSVSLIAILGGGEQKTFYSLLQVLSEVPPIDSGWLIFDEVVLSLPDWLDWLNVVVGFFADLIGVVGFFLAGIAQCILFVLYFLRWIFI